MTRAKQTVGTFRLPFQGPPPGPSTKQTARRKIVDLRTRTTRSMTNSLPPPIHKGSSTKPPYYCPQPRKYRRRLKHHQKAFHRFSELPVEIRLLVWKAALTPTPLILLQIEQGGVALFFKYEQLKVAPSLLLTNKEARSVAKPLVRYVTGMDLLHASPEFNPKENLGVKVKRYAVGKKSKVPYWNWRYVAKVVKLAAWQRRRYSYDERLWLTKSGKFRSSEDFRGIEANTSNSTYVGK